MFAKSLADLGQPRDIIMSALTVDGTLLSRMLSVAQNVPGDLVDAIGPAKQVGRDRWEDLKKRVATDDSAALARDVVAQPGFADLGSDARFEAVLSKLAAKGRAPRKATKRATLAKRTWTANGGRIKGVLGKSGKAYSLSFTSRDASEFGGYLSDNLDRIYDSFLAAQQEKTK